MANLLALALLALALDDGVAFAGLERPTRARVAAATAVDPPRRA